MPVERLFILGAIALLLLVFNRPLSIALTHVASKMGWMKATIDKLPNAITLTRAPAPDPAGLRAAAELAQAGFAPAGAWCAPPLPWLRLALMVHPDEGFLAAIETASAIGAQVNLHTLYDDGNVVSYSNTRLPAPRALPPKVTYVRRPGLPPAALLEEARRERPGNGIRNVTADDAPRLYERLYADAVKVRKATGL